MIFGVEARDEKFLSEIYERSMKELDGFFKLNWKRNRPRVFLLRDRKTIDMYRGTKTQDWIVGWVNNMDVFVLDKDTYEKESCHKYSDEEYSRLIKHELAHAFFLIVSGYKNEPDWLWEGMAMYLAGDNKKNKKPKKFTNFLEFYEKAPGVYKESGFAIECLSKKYGKTKLLSLVKSLKEIKSKEGFISKFKEIYGFAPSYKKFNDMLK